ncbi:MAG TPA: hypothetical protein VGM56_01040 [Byssovorax sp.]
MITHTSFVVARAAVRLVARREAATRHAHEIARLRDLGVRLLELNAIGSRELVARFLRDFASEDVAGRAGPACVRGDVVPFEAWLRDDCRVRDAGEVRPLAWVSCGRVVRLSRWADLPAVEIDASSMRDAWAKSWPGAFVGFDVGRALVVTLDYEVRCYDMRRSWLGPYR